MKTKKLIHYGAMALGAASLAFLATCGGGEKDSLSIQGNPLAPSASVPPSAPEVSAVLSSEEIAGLKFMREEEKLAHDVYLALSFWPRDVFKNIAESETTHTETILGLLTKYGVADPAAGKAEGVFENPDLQALYDTLIFEGKKGLINALNVGALIEETDIHDIEVHKAITKQTDILKVYNSLLCGSRNHLRAFAENLVAEGAPYEATEIDQTVWDAIANTPFEKCAQ